MVDIKEVIRFPEKMRANVAARRLNVDVDAVLESYHSLVSARQSLEDMQRQANSFAKQAQSASPAERQVLFNQGNALRSQIALQKNTVSSLQQLFDDRALTLPNWMSERVPLGSDEHSNLILSEHGTPRSFDFKPKDHLELGHMLDLIDFEAGAKVAGAKFYFLKNEAVLLQHAIKSYVFKRAIQAGFTPLQTPDIARNSVLEGVGFSPRGEESNTYEIVGLDLSLIATAEICVGGMYADEILDESRLPLLYVAESHCFRREAGTAGRSSKGLYRVHQFEKVELFAITRPDEAASVHERIRTVEEEIYSALQIPYRVVLNCSGDLGAPAYMKYDLEAWMPGKGESGEYGEITSASNCTDFQARRLGIRFKNGTTGRNEYVARLNGTACALSRTLLAIMENYQQADGSIEVPQVLRPYMDDERIMRR